jgi:hypothetical protein
MLVYVAGPLTAPTPEAIQQNIDRATRTAAALALKGHNPFVPHFSFFVDLEARGLGATIDYERWMELDFEWIARCEAFFFLGPSPGANRELLEAARLRKIIWTRIEHVPQVGDE